MKIGHYSPRTDAFKLIIMLNIAQANPSMDAIPSSTLVV